MRIEKPRAERFIDVGGKKVREVGYAQWLALSLLEKVPPGHKAPDGIITPTGMLREHIFNDMIPLKYVRPVVHETGLTDYYLTTVGKQVLAEGTYAAPPKEARKEFGRLKSLIARIRRSTLARAPRATSAGRRAA